MFLYLLSIYKRTLRFAGIDQTGPSSTVVIIDHPYITLKQGYPFDFLLE
jgi:hypothetical protein